ncbi:MAG: hypothetical protein M3Q31_22655 [Actinomycetota bacterium]|nr:hypothetical protein [Actinomycetota bacterium]
MAEGHVFDPRVILTALEEARVNYTVIGSLARVFQGSDEIAHGVDICPQRKGENFDRLEMALGRLGARPASAPASEIDLEPLAANESLSFATEAGLLRVVPLPAGTRGGWDDLRRGSQREALGGGLRVPVASLNDLLRMEAELARPSHAHILAQLRQLQEFELTMGRGLEL